MAPINMKTLLTSCLLLFISHAVVAETVQLKQGELTLNANLVKVEDNWPDGPVLLMTHGTLAHGKMEIMAGLQSMLRERGFSSLAITLGLDIDDRQGMYDCKQPHKHLHTDAVTEIGLWHAWLKEQGVSQVALLGHSRGGNQTARYAATTPDATITHVFLVAPQTWSEDYQDQDYQKRYNKPLAPLLKQAQQMVSAGQGKQIMNPVDFIYCEATQATAEAFVSYYQADPKMDTPNLIPEISYPLIVFAGSLDDTVKNLIPAAQARVDGEKSQLLVIEGADHFFRDLYSEDIADTIAETLAP
jgi:pimeloyl-ACP methyl ester carboxylesterase